MIELKEIECSISEIFEATTTLEGLEFIHDKEQFQNSTIKIQDENSKWVDIKGLITKEDKIRVIEFSDGTITKVANNHKLFDGVKEVMASSIFIGDTFIKVCGKEVQVVGNELTEIVDTVFDMEVDSEKHLYQTVDGIIHHNTELARQLSEQLGNMKLIRFDMSELHDEVSVNKLIGTSAGYVGYEEGGALINEIKKHPHSILLLDEIEKAHPKVLNIFLQVLEEAELKSADGTTADFRNVGILFTTNAGSKVGKTVGFGGSAGTSKSMAAIEKAFAPEFRNRLDGVIQFNPLGDEQIFKVTEKILNEIRDQLKSKNVQLTVTKSAKQVMANKGFDPEMGARPMKRVIQDLIKKPVAREIVLGDLNKGGRVKVDTDKEGGITLKYTSQEELNQKKAEKKAVKAENTENS